MDTDPNQGPPAAPMQNSWVKKLSLQDFEGKIPVGNDPAGPHYPLNSPLVLRTDDNANQSQENSTNHNVDSRAVPHTTSNKIVPVYPTFTEAPAHSGNEATGTEAIRYDSSMRNVTTNGKNSSSGNDYKKTESDWSLEMTSFHDDDTVLPSESKTEDVDSSLNKEKKEEKASFLSLFRFTTAFERVLIFIACIAAMANGSALPVFTLFFKDLIDGGLGGSGAGVDINMVDDTALKFLYLSLALIALGTIATGLMLYVAAVASSRLRTAYLRAVLRQDIGWFDTTRTEEITTSIEADCAAVQLATGEKVASFVQNLTTFIGGLIIGFTQSWEMSLVLMGSLPILAGSGAFMAINLSTLTGMSEKAYRSAGGVAEQAISGIRTVQSLRGEAREKERYTALLRDALLTGLKKARVNATGFGMVMGSFMGTYALGLWFGSWLIMNDRINSIRNKPFTGGDVIMCFFAIVISSFSVGQVGPAVQAFAKGQASAARVYKVLDRKPPITVEDTSGLKPSEVRGDIVLDKIKFTYPARPDAPIFHDLTLSIKAGQEVALVGSSGSGKSTVVQLVLRFYDPLAGRVTLDGVDLKDLNLVWLRTHIGLVSQEPILFARSIIENIRFGKDDATEAEVAAACEKANAAQFISTLPRGYATLCGARGTQLSGGQKQRIAIARAIVSNPKILLLDEATSALDSESEKLVQGALDNLMAGRTVIVVAHRLSTIRNADNIIVFQKGVVVEQGKHEDLVKIDNGFYKELVSKQMHQTAQAGNKHKHTQGAGDAIGPIVEEEEELAIPDLDHVRSPKAANTQHAGQIVPHDGEPEGDPNTGKVLPKGKYVRRAFMLNRPEFPWIIIGLCGALANGAVFPTLASLLTQMLSAYFSCVKVLNGNLAGEVVTFYASAAKCHADCWTDDNGLYWKASSSVSTACTSSSWGERLCHSLPDGQQGAYRTYRDRSVCYNEMGIVVRDYCLGFIGLAVGAFLANFLQLYSFGRMGEHLTKRLRELTFASVLRQNIGFFDLPENSAGALAVKLAKDAMYVEGAVGTTLGLLVQNLSLMGICLVISFTNGWLLTLICVSTFPVMVIGQYFQMQFIAGAGGDLSKSYQNAGAVASESISGMRTIAAFSCEDKVEKLYEQALDSDNSAVKKSSFGAGLGQGFSLFTMFFLYFCGFAGGSYLMKHYGYTFIDVMTVFFTITFMGMGAGQAAALAPDIGKAKPAMKSIFELVDMEPPIDAQSDEGLRPTSVQGEIVLKDVTFHYPSRREVKVFDKLNLTIPVGKTVALVGSSGSGKSTVIGLIERFYDPESNGGGVYLDGNNLKDLNLKWLRESLGLVSQEPVLFATTLLENIRYGKEDATLEEITVAAEKANAMQFINKLPAKLETMAGERGTQLSGGQKQRIAIARAIVSNPKILLLDEATSALDSQSEKIVQRALDNLMAGRTVVVVAHRLSTIRNADNIVCFKKGVVMEQGRHDDLILNPKGFYSQLVKSQMTGH